MPVIRRRTVRRAGGRPTPEPTAKSADGYWMCCAPRSFPSPAELDVAWLTDTAQRDRALESLLADALVTRTVDGRFALPGEGF